MGVAVGDATVGPGVRLWPPDDVGLTEGVVERQRAAATGREQDREK